MENRAIFSGKLLPYLLILPQLAVSLIFFYWPAVQALQQSFLVQDAFGLSTEFVWFENYVNLLQTPEYYQAIGVTFVFSALVAFFSLTLGLLLAVMANRNIRRHPDLPHVSDRALCGGAGGRQRALHLHVPARARHDRAACCNATASTGIRC